MTAGFDPGPIRRLVEQICADPAVVLITADGAVVRPVSPPVFESLPHPVKVCQAAVKVLGASGAPFNISLCDVHVLRSAHRGADAPQLVAAGRHPGAGTEDPGLLV